MSKPNDATAKDLIEADPAGWVTYLGHPVAPDVVTVVDADVSTVTAAADKVIRVDEPAPWLLHLELQANWDGELDRRLLQYNSLLARRHQVPVASVVVLLRPEANSTALTGVLPSHPPVGPGWEFRYDVVRVWERPAAEFLGGPLGLLPFAPIARVPEAELARVVAAMRARLDPQPDPAFAQRLWAATYVLMGLRFDETVGDNLLSGVMQMEESTTYQAILRRGEAKGRQMGELDEARRIVLRLGRMRFGPPPPPVGTSIEAVEDKARLEALAERVLTASSWDDLLATS